MNLKLGIIGLPNVGKSTLFKNLTKLNIATDNFPFCTIEPNIGIVHVIDYRIKKLSSIINPDTITPATIEFIDVAGLISGSSKGKGLGNYFLSKIRETKAIIHVVRCFKDDHIIHVSGKINPKRDIEEINNELLFSDLEVCERSIYKTRKNFKSFKKLKDIEMKISVLEKCLSHLINGGMLRTLNLSDSEKNTIEYLNFLTLKPIMYVANINFKGIQNNFYLEEVKSIAKEENSVLLIICAKTEVKNNFSCKKYIQFNYDDNLHNKQETSTLDKVIDAGFNLLNIKTYFTTINNKLRAWTIPKNYTAIQAAERIHTDFKKRFIRAQIISYIDFINYRGEHGAKELGKIYFKGKSYIIKDGDIVNFIIRKN